MRYYIVLFCCMTMTVCLLSGCASNETQDTNEISIVSSSQIETSSSSASIESSKTSTEPSGDSASSTYASSEDSSESSIEGQSEEAEICSLPLQSASSQISDNQHAISGDTDASVTPSVPQTDPSNKNPDGSWKSAEERTTGIYQYKGKEAPSWSKPAEQEGGARGAWNWNSEWGRWESHSLYSDAFDYSYPDATNKKPGPIINSAGKSEGNKVDPNTGLTEDESTADYYRQREDYQNSDEFKDAYNNAPDHW